VTATATRERPILFSGPMVKAILDGRKTMTRRIMKPQPEYFEQYPHWRWTTPQLRKDGLGPFAIDSGDRPGIFGKYVPGETLWVREAWHPSARLGTEYEIEYRADKSRRTVDAGWNGPTPQIDAAIAKDCWRPSIFMPRWASRITLEITDVRVERLQEITNADAEAEGVGGMRDMRFAVALGNLHTTGHRFNFRDLWESINGKGSWESNPWVWVVSFRNSKGAADDR
jgi:hypothetical protein